MSRKGICWCELWRRKSDYSPLETLLGCLPWEEALETALALLLSLWAIGSIANNYFASASFSKELRIQAPLKHAVQYTSGLYSSNVQDLDSIAHIHLLFLRKKILVLDHLVLGRDLEWPEALLETLWLHWSSRTKFFVAIQQLIYNTFWYLSFEGFVPFIQLRLL